MSRFINVQRIKKYCKERGKRVGSDFLLRLEIDIEHHLEAACSQHNGGRQTLKEDMADLIGLKGTKAKK